MVEREVADAVDVLGREVRAGDQQCAASRDEGFVDIGFRNRHVGTVFAQKNQRKRVLVLDSEHHRTGEPGRIGADMANVAAFARERFHQEATQMIVADAGDQGRLESEPCASKSRVGGRATEILGEARHILEASADLLRVEVDCEPAEADDVERALGSEGGAILHR